MQALSYYLVYPIIYLIALLPFPLLYAVSDLMYHALKLVGYRRKVVLKNLRNSFPEKSDLEIRKLASDYFRFMADVTLETLKNLRMTANETQERCHFIKKDWLEEMYREKRSIIVLFGHLGNWEWVGPSFTLNCSYPFNCIYRPLANPYFDKMVCRMRTRYGTEITPAANTLRAMVARREQVYATGLIADQAANKKDAIWTTFMNQETAVFAGPEKLAKKFDCALVFLNVTRPKRGHYTVEPELMLMDPGKTAPGEITEMFTQRMERAIRQDPAIWLWSHRRWKHKRPQNAPLHTDLSKKA